MVKAWYISDEEPDTIFEKKSDRLLNPPQYLTLDELKRKSGVLYDFINVDKYSTEEKLSELCSQRGYNYSDVLDIHPSRLENYYQKLDAFYTEHMHPEEEIRLVLNGSGYFDVRDVDNRWIRIGVEKGDLLTLPAGSYHRFTIDIKNNWIKLFRLFGSQPEWLAFNRPADEHPARIQYVQRAVKGF